MALTAQQVHQFYVGYYGRPADTAGLAYWQGQTEAAALAGFSASAEFTTQYASAVTTAAKVTQVYNNLLGRAPDAAGLTYWSGEITAGRETLGTLLLSVVKNALGKDVTTIADRVAYSTSFTAALDTLAEINAYNGTAATGLARVQMGSIVASAVGDHTTLTTATGNINTTTTSIVNLGTSGQSFSLTNSATPDAPVMTAGNDTVTGALGTIADTDRVIDNSVTDADVFNAVLNVNTAKPQVINIETLNVSGEYTTTGFDFANAVGVKAANFSAGISGATATVSNVAAASVAAVKAGSNIGTLVASTGANGTGGTVTVDGGSAASVTIHGTASKTNTYDVTLGTAATTLVMNGDAGVDTFTVNLSGSTIGTFNTDNGAIESLTIKSSGATNTLTLNSTDLLVGKVSTLATNKATLTGDKSLTIKGSAAGIDGVAVVDSTTAGTTTFTTNTATIVDAAHDFSRAAFDVINFANAFAAANTVTVNDGSTAKLSIDVGKDNTYQVQNTAQTLAAAAGSGGTLNMDVAITQANKIITGDKVDTLKLSVASATADVTLAEIDMTNTPTTVFTGSKNVTLTLLTGATDGVFSATGFTGKLTLTDTSAHKLVVISGSGNDDLTTTSAATGTVVRGGDGNDKITTGANATIVFGDAGNDSITGGNAADTVDGGAGNDTIDGGAGADVISGGAGDDLITGGNGVDTMTGGDGADTFVVSVGTTTNGPDVITDFVGGSDKVKIGASTNAGSVLLDLRTLGTTAQTTVNNKASVSDAAAEVLNNAGSGYTAAANDVILFNYKTDVYAYVNLDTTAAVAGTDYLVKLTGISGTVTAADFLVA